MRRIKMQDRNSLLEEITDLEQSLRKYISKGKSSEAVQCQQQIVKNKLKLAKMKQSEQ
jgi:SSXT protein (N-terminal region).